MNYYWRLFGTFLSFGLFGLGGIIASLTIFPVIYILPIARPRKIILSRRIMRFCFRGFIAFMKIMGVLSYSIHNAERLQGRQDLLIVANHPTLVDVVFLIALAELPNCVIKRGVWNNPCMFFMVRSAGFIKNSATPEDFLHRCTETLNKGDGLIIFPEGTRTPPNGDITMHRGCAHIALNAKKNLTPVSITCHPITLTKHHRWYNIPKTKKPHFCISVGDDIEIADFLSIKDDHNNAARQLTAHMKDKFIEGMTCQT